MEQSSIVFDDAPPSTSLYFFSSVILHVLSFSF